MFSRSAKSVVKNFGQKNYHAGKGYLKNTQAFVLAAERSHVPGILTPLVGHIAEKPVFNLATTSEQSGLVALAAKQNSLNEKVEYNATNEEMILSEAVTVDSQKTSNSCEPRPSRSLESPRVR